MGVAQVNDEAGERQASYEAEDGTLYWTLSFYIPYSALCPGSAPEVVGDIPPMPPSFDAATRLKQLDEMQNAATREVRDAVDPLFNDIADRTRQGDVLDRLLVDGKREEVAFHLPESIGWKTEGRRFQVALAKGDRERPAEMRRFWYLHSDGAMSWHVAFAVRYGKQLEAELKEGRVSSLYFLSLLQKLAWPKECDASGIKSLSTDAMLKVKIGPKGTAKPKLFWGQVEDWFKADGALLRDVHPAAVAGFGTLFPMKPCIEVPGLNTCETRSLFFIQDKDFFELIQPKTAKGVLVARRERILDDVFEHYPKRVREIVPDAGNVHLLDDAFWADLLSENEASEKAAARAAEDAENDDFPLPNAAQRLRYLFLAGFNQNIIDWANQEASEVLDSLDPIYPSSDEQLEEGFFIRYANPRSLITYVQRSRTLEVGNDHILTCPYAFLIHVLAMNNEHLTRQKEKRAFDVIKWVSGQLPAYDPHSQNEMVTKQVLAGVEQQINRLRIDSFEHFDRHRYFNPFRYDTERDVFEELERLRGMSRLEVAYKEALKALEEQARDLERIRADTESERESRQEKRLAALFGLIGFSGVGQLLFNWYDYLHPDEKRIHGIYDYSLWGAQALLIAIMVAGMIMIWPGRRQKD